MRLLKRNMQTLYFSNYLGKAPAYKRRENGNVDYIEINGESIPLETGDYEDTYSLPQKFSGNISASKGSSEESVFGVALDYSKTLVTYDKDLDINETSRIWYETTPTYVDEYDFDIDTADYTVVGIARSLNYTVYALKQIVKNR